MNVTSIPNHTTIQKNVSFKANPQKAERQYIDRRTESKIGMGSFIGNIVGSSTLGGFLFKKVAGNLEDLNNFKALPTKIKVAAFAASALGTLVVGFIGGKIAGSWGKAEADRPSNAAVAKLTAASLVGMTAGEMAGSAIGVGSLSFVIKALLSVFGSDAAVKLTANMHNKTAKKPPVPNTTVLNTNEGPIVVQDFRQFLNKTQQKV